ncbi:acyltransferase family protein [Enterobacter sp. JUb54]|uniref:acyltransferase family protein n=1 Tax=Enterobacteriaceae TaxID=543 RepID=UPI00164D7654|nr:acyltransferase [Enterobacter sp. JUb54]QNK08300.1 acyltransferase [Enterobacter sp. JUb54]
MISVQQLRGIAVLLVVLFHMTTKLRDNGIWEYGFSIGMSGVDIFFVISGFIMMLISNRENNFFVFLLKRVIRIYPVYLIVATVFILMFYSFPGISNAHNLDKKFSLINTLTLLPIDNNIVMVGWTLSYELFFYLVFAICMQFSIKKEFSIPLVILSLFILGRLCNNDFLSNSVVFEFVLGIFSYLVYKGRCFPKSAAVKILMIFISVGWMYYSPAGIRFIDLGIPSFIIFNSYVSLFKNAGKGVLSTIGDASYSIYLTHLLSISAVFLIEHRFLGINNPILLYISMLLPALVFGIIFHMYIEKPVINYLNSKTKRLVLKNI